MKIVKNLIFYLIVIVLLVLIGKYSYKVYAEYKDNTANIEIRDDISESIVFIEDVVYVPGDYDDSIFPTDIIEELKKNPDEYELTNPESSKFISADFDALKAENEETVAWLYVPGTAINYSVVQTVDNDHYLKYNFKNEKNRAGWIFGDYRSNFDKLNRNTVIYGHNQLDKSMFGSLSKLITEKNWFDDPEHKYVYLATPKASYVFEVVSVYSTNDNKYIKHGLYNDETYQEFIDYILSKNTISGLSKDVDTGDKILTLSTCYSKMRLSVQCKLIRTKLTR
jgi:sortase B